MANKYADLAKEARKERDRTKSCENKKKYASKAEAATTGNKTYKCRYCDGWHTSAARQTFINRLCNRVKRQ